MRWFRIGASLAAGLCCLAWGQGALAEVRPGPSLRQESAALTERTVALAGELRWVGPRASNRQEPPHWVLEFVGSYTVPAECGGSWRDGSAVTTLVARHGMTLVSDRGRKARVAFVSHDDLMRCVGVGTRFSFASDGWVPFFENRYRGGGFVVDEHGLTFLKGTFVRTADGQIWSTNGRSWREQPDPHAARRSPFVREAQLRLLDSGIDPGPVDGVLGEQTSLALKRYQREQGLPITGRLDRLTFERLGIE